MARPLIAPLAPGIALFPGYTVKLIAVDGTTGVAVGGVVVSNVSMQVDKEEPEDTSTVPIVAPLYTYT